MPDNGDHRAYVGTRACSRAGAARGRPIYLSTVIYGVGRRRPDVVVAVGVLAWVLASALGPGVVVMIDLHVAAAVGAEGRGWATAWRSGAARRRGDWISTALVHGDIVVRRTAG